MNIARLFTFRTELWLPRPLEEVFNFFSDAANLQAITPDWLDFKIVTPAPLRIRQGALIDYKLRVRGFPIRWQTEITAWEPPVRFIDEQKRGPYKVWIHEHRFVSRENGTQISDFVQYYPPGGWLVDKLFVRRDVRSIFAFRAEKLRGIFERA